MTGCASKTGTCHPLSQRAPRERAWALTPLPKGPRGPKGKDHVFSVRVLALIEGRYSVTFAAGRESYWGYVLALGGRHREIKPCSSCRCEKLTFDRGIPMTTTAKMDFVHSLRCAFFFSVASLVACGSSSNASDASRSGTGGFAVAGGTNGGNGGAMAVGGSTGAGGARGTGGDTMAMNGAMGGMMSIGGLMMDSGGMMTGEGGMMMDSGVVMDTGGTLDHDAGAACQAAGTLQVSNSGMTAYVIDGASNPTLTFCRGNTYVFSVNASGHPFYLKTVKGTGTGNAYTSGVSGNGVTTGDLTFTVPSDAPDTLFYVCSLHSAMTGIIHIVN
jgi:hypothetical protein